MKHNRPPIRILCALLSLVLVPGVLSACADEAENPEGPSSDTEAATGYALLGEIGGVSAVVMALGQTKSSGISSMFAKSSKQAEKGIKSFCEKWSKLP